MKRIILYALSIIFVSAPVFGMNLANKMNFAKLGKNAASKSGVPVKSAKKLILGDARTPSKNKASKVLKVEEPKTPDFEQIKKLKNKKSNRKMRLLVM